MISDQSPLSEGFVSLRLARLLIPLVGFLGVAFMLTLVPSLMGSDNPCLVARALGLRGSAVPCIMAQALVLSLGLLMIATAELLPDFHRIPGPVIAGVILGLARWSPELTWMEIKNTGDWEPSWQAGLATWGALLLLIHLSLRAPKPRRLWLRRVGLVLGWLLLLMYAAAPYGIRSILVPLLAWPVFLLFWRRRTWAGAGLGAAMLGALLTFMVSNPYRSNWFLQRCRMGSTQSLDDSAQQVRHAMAFAGWFGHPSSRVPEIPGGARHYVVGLLAFRWGWLGVALGLALLFAFLVLAFRIALRHRKRPAGEMLAILTFILALSTAMSLSMSFGFPGYGVTLPLLGLDPALAGVALVAAVLMRRLSLSGDSFSQEAIVKASQV